MTDPQHQERSHAILAPSFMHTALACPGSVLLKEKAPPSPSNPASILGTKIHEAADTLLSSFLQNRIDGSEVVEPEPETKEILEFAKGYVQAIWKEALQEVLTGKAYGIEERLSFDDRLSIWGHADFWAVGIDERARRYGLVCDLKTGGVYVEVKNNPQLATYALALRREIRSLGKDLDYVRVGIYQPKALDDEGRAYREVKFTAKQLDKWEEKILKLAETVYSDKKPKFKAGEHCRYCPGQALCKTYAGTLSKESSLALVNAEEFTFPEVSVLPDEVLVKITLAEKQVTSFVKSCKKLLMTKLFNGQKIGGVKLVEKKGKRSLDASKIEELAKLFEANAIPVTYVPDISGIGAVTKTLQTKFSKKEADEIVKSYCKEGSVTATLATSDDPRPEVKDALSLLADVETDE